MSASRFVDELAGLIAASHRIVAFTGAGASTGSGVPDLAGTNQILRADRGFSGSVFSLLDPGMAQRNPSEFYRLYRRTFFQPQAVPNATHRVLAELERLGRLIGVVTMNVDFLHQEAGQRTVAEYWGDVRDNRCASCGARCDWRRLVHEEVPRCQSCGGVMLPDFVLRSLAPYPDQMRRGRQMLANGDLALVVGTRQIPEGLRRDARLAVVCQGVGDVRGADLVCGDEPAEDVFAALERDLPFSLLNPVAGSSPSDSHQR